MAGVTLYSGVFTMALWNRKFGRCVTDEFGYRGRKIQRRIGKKLQQMYIGKCWRTGL